MSNFCIHAILDKNYDGLECPFSGFFSPNLRWWAVLAVLLHDLDIDDRLATRGY